MLRVGFAGPFRDPRQARTAPLEVGFTAEAVAEKVLAAVESGVISASPKTGSGPSQSWRKRP